MPRALAALLVLLLFAAPALSGGDDSEADAERQLRQVVAAFLDAVRKHDVKRILGAIRSDGLTCGDSFIPMTQIEKDLADKTSDAYVYLFSAAEYAKRPGLVKPSLDSVLSSPGSLTVRITMNEPSKETSERTACSYISGSETQDAAELCWVTRKGEWRLEEGIYFCL